MENNIEIKAIELILPDGNTIQAEFHIWDFDPDDPQMVRLDLKFADRDLTRTEKDYFSALCSIRHELEKENILINCYGGSRNVYPSAMSLDMGAGEKAYKMELGKHARLNDIVAIFDTGPDVIPATVGEQRAFFEDWTKGIISS